MDPTGAPSAVAVGLEHMPWLTIAIFLPAVGAILVAGLPRLSARAVRVIALGFTTVTLAVAAGLAVAFDGSSAAFQLGEPAALWVPGMGVYYQVALDGISLWLFELTAVLSVVAVLGAWTGVTHRVRTFFICLLLLETAMLGVFAALDLVLFYVFWEAMLVPMYFIIGIWGSDRRLYAAVKFFLYTLVGGVLMLAGIAVLYFSLPDSARTFSIPDLLAAAPTLDLSRQMLLFVLFSVAFAIKVPLVPFHTWLPDAHVEAPTSGSILLAGVLLKMGAYGFLRLSVGLFPAAAEVYAPLLMWLAVIGILYGGATAMWQKDMKRLIAYSSVSHLGFVILGIFAFHTIGMQGAVLQMVNHGLSTGALFLLVGMIYERRHTRMIADYGGLWEEMPLYSRVFLVVALSSIGLPGLNGFVGEFLTLLGTSLSRYAEAGLWTALSTLGVVVAACYLLWMYKRVFYGEAKPARSGPMPDMRPAEIAASVLLLAGIVWLGVRPGPVLDSMRPAVEASVQRVDDLAGAAGSAQVVFGATSSADSRLVRGERPEVTGLGGDEADAGGEPQ